MTTGLMSVFMVKKTNEAIYNANNEFTHVPLN